MNEILLKDVGLDRLWKKAVVNGNTWCWIWQGARDGNGYGEIRIDGKLAPAHRVAYESVFGPIPPGLVIDHLCRTPLCINPWHLEAVTYSENSKRGETGHWFRQIQRAKTECPRGHPYDETNTYIRPDGGRDCRACIRLRTAKYRAKIKGGLING